MEKRRVSVRKFEMKDRPTAQGDIEPSTVARRGLIQHVGANWQRRNIAMLLIGVMIAGAGIWFCLSRKDNAVVAKVTIFDPRLRILRVRPLKGTNTYYLPDGGNVLGSEDLLGSRMEGELRQRISKLGVKIDTLPAFKPGTNASGRAFLVSYAFPNPPASSVHLSAELRDQNGAHYSLRNAAGGGGGPPERSWDLWCVDSLPVTGTTLTLCLNADSNGPCVAEIQFLEPEDHRRDLLHSTPQ